MKRKANPGEIAKARREKGRIIDALRGKIEITGGVSMMHLESAVGLRISVAPGQKALVENILSEAGLLVPYIIRERPTPHKQEN